jgi:hypothetical protein
MDISKGYAISEPINEEQAYKVRNQCLTYNGKYVRLEDGDPRKIPTVPMEKGGDGIYTYLFDQNRKLHTAKVENQFEIGSLHRTLAYRGNVTHVLAAGELKKTGNKVEYNLLSGTFMKPWMEELGRAYDAKIKEQAQELFKKAGFSATFVETGFITEDKVPVTKEQLDSYKAAGFQVKLYANRRYCRSSPQLIRAQIEQWTGKPDATADLKAAEEDLAHSGEYTVYGGRRSRRMTRKYCKKTACKKMGFTQRASCRPYKNCYKNKK